MSIRAIKAISGTRSTREGAGVKLERVFGFGDTPLTDPFLLMDDFRNDRPEDYAAGFPWHPHRGIETITYVLAGSVDHTDSLGNSGSLGPGSVQWMTAGSGIMHQEMPRGDEYGHMHGFQLWANLPSQLKMTQPRYQDIASSNIPVASDDDGTRVRIVVGEYRGIQGPVDGVAAEPQYLDISIPPGRHKVLSVDTYHSTFAYVFEGWAFFRDASPPVGVLLEKELEGQDVHLRDQSGNRTLIVFDTGDEIVVQAGDAGVRFLLVSGKPIREPVAWHGPIVMNTHEELEQAFTDLKTDNFLRDQAGIV